MNHDKKSKLVTSMSLIIIVALIITAVVLGAGVGKSRS